ncbi:MAG: hypothetical protein HY894_06725 [Deltaproteobacteria bacterium]|nr:hypothetical protein [Deltaproteobacteria bacterium]
MEIGFNQNFKYKGVVCHVQTEDGGVNNPVITTHIFKDGGTIFASRRASYADAVNATDRDEQVKRMMREQTIALLKDLKAGKFDHLIERNKE